MHLSRAGVPTGVVSVPLRYMHSPVEMVSLADVQVAAELIAAFAKRLEPGMSFERQPVASAPAPDGRPLLLLLFDIDGTLLERQGAAGKPPRGAARGAARGPRRRYAQVVRRTRACIDPAGRTDGEIARTLLLLGAAGHRPAGHRRGGADGGPAERVL